MSTHRADVIAGLCYVAVALTLWIIWPDPNVPMTTLTMEGFLQ